MDDRSITAVSVLVLLLLVSIFAIVAYISRKPRSKREESDSEVQLPAPTEEELARDMQTASEMGYIYDGPTCVVCRLRASEYAPITGTSWMDKLPLLNRLYSLSPRHVIVDNNEGDICFCRLHKQMAVSLLAQAHAQLRADRAKFNSAQEARIAALDGGEVLQQLIQMHREHVKSLKVTMETPLPKLAEHNSPIITTTVVTSSARIVDEDD